jgi:hypothetical protein
MTVRANGPRMDDQRTNRAGGGMSDTTDNKRIQFSLSLIALSAIVFGAYRIGYQHGCRAAIAEHTADYVTFNSF